MGRVVRVLTLLVLTVALEARAQNLVQNGDFSGGLGVWSIIPGGNYSVSWDGAVGNNAAGAVFINLTIASAGTEAYFASQCVPVLASATYDVSGSFMFPSSVGTTPTSSIVVQAFSDAGCTTSAGSLAGFGISILASPPNTWHRQDYIGGYLTPATAAAVKVYLLFRTPAAGLASGWFDDINFSKTLPVELQQFSID